MKSDLVDPDNFIKRACELGAVEAKIIAADSVVTAAWVRLKCQFGCGRYNTSHCCPPHTPTPQQTQDVVDCYTRALLIHCKRDVSPTKIVVKLEREIFLSGFYKTLGFGAGPCNLCKQCHLNKCRQPEHARPAMEACGIDVYATVRNNGYPVDVLNDSSGDENWYGLILID